MTFPAAELDSQGRTIEYRYRGYTASNRIVAAVDCVIPATDAAIERMNRKLKVTRWHRVGSGFAPGGARMSVGSALFDLNTEETALALAPVVGTAQWCGTGYIGTYPNCYPISSGTVSEPESEPDGEWTWWEGTDTGSEPDDGTERDPCARDAAGNCKTREIKPDEWTRLLERIAAIKEDTDYCRGAKQALSSLAQRGPESQRLRFWDGFDIGTNPDTGDREQRFGQNLSDADGRYIEFDSYWIWNDPVFLVHEGLHLWLAQNPDNSGRVPPDPGDWIDDVQADCV